MGQGISIPALTSAISAAVIKGLTDSGVISCSSGNLANTTDANASVQDAVDDVVNDLTGEGHDTSNSILI